MLINGKHPGPTIWSDAGDRVIVEFVNLLGVPSTLHWHGQKQIKTNIMDGVDPVTQVGTPGLLGRRLASAAGTGPNVTEPPPPTYLYDFITDAPGAYWYHDHSSDLTYVNGLRGALIVSDPWSPVLPVYKSRPVAFIADDYHEVASTLLAQYINPNNTGKKKEGMDREGACELGSGDLTHCPPLSRWRRTSAKIFFDQRPHRPHDAVVWRRWPASVPHLRHRDWASLVLRQSRHGAELCQWRRVCVRAGAPAHNGVDHGDFGYP